MNKNIVSCYVARYTNAYGIVPNGETYYQLMWKEMTKLMKVKVKKRELSDGPKHKDISDNNGVYKTNLNLIISHSERLKNYATKIL